MSGRPAALAADATDFEGCPEVRVVATFPTGPSRALWHLRLVSYTLLLGGLLCSLQVHPGLVTVVALAAAMWVRLKGRAPFAGYESGTLVLHDDASLAWFDDGGVRGGAFEPTASVSLADMLFMRGRLEGSSCWLCLSRAESRPEHWLVLRRWLLWRHRGGRPARAGLESRTSALS